jgi:type IV pilus assembly protein PilZ
MSSGQGSNKRRFIRVPVALSIQFCRLEDFGEFVEANATDLSQGGIFIKTDKPRPVGTRVQMQISIPGKPTVHLRGMVRHIRYDLQMPDNPPLGMGIEFENLDKDSQKLILQLLEMLNR